MGKYANCGDLRYCVTASFMREDVMIRRGLQVLAPSSYGRMWF